MKILVLVKESLRLERGFEIEGDRIDDRYFERGLNDCDEYALEEAVQISEDRDDVEVTTATIGPFYSVTTIKRALSLGADRAYRVWDDALEEGILRDPRTTASILSAIVEREQPDLVLAGAQSEDEAFGATGVLVAEERDYNWVAVADELTLAENEVTIRREIEGGLVETSNVSLPAVVSIQSGINEPRYVSTRSIHQQSSEDDITNVNLDDLELDESVLDSKLEVLSVEKPAQSVETSYIEGDTSEEAAHLIDVLETEGVLR